jgi:hypothetical protein
VTRKASSLSEADIYVYDSAGKAALTDDRYYGSSAGKGYRTGGGIGREDDDVYPDEPGPLPVRPGGDEEPGGAKPEACERRRS